MSVSSDSQAMPSQGDTRHFICKMAELARNKRVLFKTPQGQSAILLEQNGSVYAFLSLCPHAKGSLDDCLVDESMITCVWHGWQFGLDNGICKNDPDFKLTTISIHVVDNDVFMKNGNI